MTIAKISEDLPCASSCSLSSTASVLSIHYHVSLLSIMLHESQPAEGWAEQTLYLINYGLCKYKKQLQE
jgi:hypothetical protein